LTARVRVDIYANYLSLVLVVLKTFNRQRAHIAISHYFASSPQVVLSPKEVARQEGVWRRVWSDGGELVLGASLASFEMSAAELRRLQALFASGDEKYISNEFLGMDNANIERRSCVVHLFLGTCWRSGAGE
jgi:hypothetical protein